MVRRPTHRPTIPKGFTEHRQPTASGIVTHSITKYLNGHTDMVGAASNFGDSDEVHPPAETRIFGDSAFN